MSFLIPPEMVPGRMALLVTLFLVLTEIYTNVANQSPVSNSINQLSVWMITCIFFVFGALMEYAGLLFVRYQSYIDPDEAFKNSSLMKTIDLFFFTTFPIIFLIFNVTYWLQAYLY